jgi:hypothetical protein
MQNATGDYSSARIDYSRTPNSHVQNDTGELLKLGFVTQEQVSCRDMGDYSGARFDHSEHPILMQSIQETSRRRD